MNKKTEPAVPALAPIGAAIDTPFLHYAGDDEKGHIRVLLHAETIWSQRLM